MEQNDKKSKLIFDMKITRKLLKMNPIIEPKYCRYCGKLLSENCGCKQPNEVIDVKPLRDHPEATIAIFRNTPGFKKDFDEVMLELKAKQESNNKIDEPLEMED